MKNAQPHTNAEPSALVQRDISSYRGAVVMFSWHVLSRKDFPPSPIAIAHRHIQNRLPHSFHPVGDGLHVIPITRQGFIAGFPVGILPTEANLPRFRRLWLPEWGIDRRYLILGSFLWVEYEELIDHSPLGRQLFALRAGLALRPLGFPILKGIGRQAVRLMHAELAAKEQGAV